MLKPNKEWNPKELKILGLLISYRTYNIENNTLLFYVNAVKIVENILNKKVKKNFIPAWKDEVVFTYEDFSRFVDYFRYKPDTAVKMGLVNFCSSIKVFIAKC